MTRILGIDPGSRITGYGLIEDGGQKPVLIACGCIRTESDHFPLRLKQIYDGIREVVCIHKPDELAVEQVFVQKNIDSALKLGQARGAAICGALTLDLAVFEYAAREVKKALVGKGSADKLQVQHMVKILLNLQDKIQIDASDALAVALCHSHSNQTAKRIEKMRLRLAS